MEGMKLIRYKTFCNIYVKTDRNDNERQEDTVGNIFSLIFKEYSECVTC